MRRAFDLLIGGCGQEPFGQNVHHAGHVCTDKVLIVAGLE